MTKPRINLGSSYTIGSHILPGEPIQTISELFNSSIKLSVDTCEKIIDGVKSDKYEIGLIETPIFDDALIYDAWMEDELVLCSRVPMGESVDLETLKSCKLLCRSEHSLTRKIITEFLAQHDLSYETFGSLMQIDNATSAIQGIKWSKPNPEKPTVAIVSELCIEDELKNKQLYSSRMTKTPLSRKFFLIYKEEKQESELVQKIREYLNHWGANYKVTH